MIPLKTEVSIQNKRGPGLWLLMLPLWLVWLLLLPLALLLSPLIMVACLIARVNPVRALSVVWQILAGLKGTQMVFDTNHRSVQVHIT